MSRSSCNGRPLSVSVRAGGFNTEEGGGRKDYRDEAGEVTKVLEWFGYTLRLLMDGRHEVALGWRVTSPGADDGNAWGIERFHAQVGALMVVQPAVAMRLAERTGRTRRPVSWLAAAPIAAHENPGFWA